MHKWHGVKFLIPYLKPYKVKIIFTFLSMLGVASTTALSAYMMKPILNNIFVQKDQEMLYIIPFIIIIIFVLRGIFRFFSTYLSSYIGIEVTKQLRAKMFAQAINTEFATIQEKSIGDINAHIIQTVLNIQNLISKAIPKYLISFLTIIGLIVMIVYLNWKLSLLAIIFASIIIYPVKYLGKKVKKQTTRSEQEVSTLSDKVNETFTHLDLVKIYNNTEYEKDNFLKILNVYSKFLIKLTKYKEATSPIMELFVSLAIASVVFFGGLSVIKDGMSVGDFFAFLTALLMIYGPVKVVTKNAMVLNMLDSYIQRVEEILSLPIEHNHTDTKISKIDTIEFKNVSLSINGTDILKNLNFTIHKNETIAFVGKTGAGKSSILSLIFGFRKPSSGKILINSIDITTIDKESLRQQLSYVNQGAGIFNTSIKENVIYGLPYNPQKFLEAIKLAHCEFIDKLPQKEEYIVGENGKKLSGGQRQRVALARALYKNGSIFILDEATSALDSHTENLIQDSLSHIIQEKTTILIAHRLNTIKNANKVIVLSHGEIIEFGSYDKVSQSEAFQKNFALQKDNNEQ